MIFIFKVQVFEFFYICEYLIDGQKKKIAIRQEFGHLPSNGAIANDARYDLHLLVRSSILDAGQNTILSFFQNLLPFSSFPGRVENTNSLFDLFEIVIKVFEV